MDAVALVTGGGTVELWGVVLVCAGLLVAGFVDAIAGGGGLISLPMFLIAGLPVHAVIGTNKLASCMGTAVATAKYVHEGYLRWRLVLPCVAIALLGSFAGANLSLLANETLLRVVMLVVIPLAGFHVLRARELGAGKEPWGARRTLALCAGIALGVGFYDGFYGPGTGTFLMLLLTSVGRLRVTDAAGTTKAINLTTNTCGMLVFLVNGAVMVPLGLLAGCFCIVGNYLGARLFTRRGAAVVRPLMLVVLVIFAARLIGELAGVI